MLNPAQVKRTIGMLSGSALACLGALGMWISKSNYDSPLVHRFCEAWFCPDEFSPQRVFELGQKATLGDAPGQLRDFQNALLADSGSAYRWADLGESEFNVHDVAKARYAFARALDAGPRSPVILLRAANFYFQLGDYGEVVRELSKVLRDTDLYAYYDTVFLTYSRLGLPLKQILDQGIPPKTTAGAQFLRFWINSGRLPEARQTWEWLASRQSIDESAAGAYVDFLLGKNEDTLAQSTWRDYTRAEMPAYCETNWIFNGDFEAPFKPSALDWKVNASNGVDVERIQIPGMPGQWSLQMLFHADDNLDYRQTYQNAVLTPGKWRFAAQIKTDKITTDEGPHFHLEDSRHPSNLQVWTKPETGTADWHENSVEFSVGPNTTLVRVELLRSPSTHFDNKITGTAWIDQVSLTPVK